MKNSKKRALGPKKEAPRAPLSLGAQGPPFPEKKKNRAWGAIFFFF